jgi:hypothetical protein
MPFIHIQKRKPDQAGLATIEKQAATNNGLEMPNGIQRTATGLFARISTERIKS